MDLKELYEKTIEEGKTFILTEDMIGVEIKNIDKPIRSLDDLVMVHKTNYFPYGAVKTPFETKKTADWTIKCTIDGEEKTYIIPFKSYRNTAHFCLNGAVKSHTYGGWDETKYAIFMPLAKNKDKIIAGTECDLFSWGSVPITDNGYILCPKNELDMMREANPTAHIVGYEGTSVSPYVNVFLNNILEYKYKPPTQESREWDSGNSEDHRTVTKLIQENGWKYTSHNGTSWDYDDLTQQYTDVLTGWLKTIVNEKILYSAHNIDEIKKTIIDIFDIVNLLSGFGYAGAFNNENRFSIICKMVKSETGIDLSHFAGTKTLEDFYLINRDFAQSTVADYIINELRIRALKEKVQTGKMTEEDIFELNYYNEFGTYSNITPERREIFRKLEDMHSKSLKKLSKDEIEMVLEATNFKLQNINKLSKVNQYNFKLMYLDEITEEQSKDAAKVGIYIKPIKSGIYLIAQIPNSWDIYSKLSGVDIRSLEDKLNYADDAEAYVIGKQIANIPNCHLIEFKGHGFGDITDFDLSKCDTVEDLEISIMKYAECFSKFVSGQIVEFNSLGSILSKQENDKTQVINDRTIKISEIVYKFAALSGIQDKQVCEDLISKLSNLNVNDSIDSILVSLKNMLGKGLLTVEQIISNADLIISLNPDKYKSFDDLINRLKWIESMNMEYPRMPLTENHRLVVEAFDKFNELIGTQFDCFYTGGLMGYLATNHELERYHGDLDLFINEEQLPLLYSLVQQSKDFEFISNMDHKEQSGHEFKINYKGTEMSIGLFLFSRLPNNEVVLKDYYYQDQNKSNGLVVNESHLSGSYASMLFSTTPREHNGFSYKMQSLEGIYYSKKGSRPKDEYDAKVIENYVDMGTVSRLDDEKKNNYTVQNRTYDSNIVSQLDETIRNQSDDKNISQETTYQRL